MRRCTVLTIFVLLGCISSITIAQRKLNHLKEWVGKYPTYNNFKPHREFLKLPEINQTLLKLLSRDDYRFLTRTCGKEVPIEMVDDFLIVRRCHSFACGNGAATLVVNLNDGAMHVAIDSGKEPGQRWFSTNGKYKELPFEILSGGLFIRDKKNGPNTR